MSEHNDEVLTNDWVKVIRRAQLGRTTTAVAVMLATWANPDGTRVRPGLARLAVSCEITYNVAQSSTATLRALGLIRMTHKATGKHDTDVYRLTLPSDLAARVTVLADEQVDAAINKMLEQKRGKYTAKHATPPTATGRAKVPTRPASPVDNPAGSVDSPDPHPTRWGAEENAQTDTDPSPAPHAVGHEPVGAQPSAPHAVGHENGSAPHGVVRLHPTPLATTLHDPPLKSKADRQDRLPEPLKTIFESLSAFDPDATADEARAVHRLIAARHAPRSVKYFTRIAEDGGFAGYLSEVRAAAAEDLAVERAKQLREIELGEPCCHGTPGGATLQPGIGTALCPYCRRGAPPTPPPPPLDEAGSITATYGKTRTANGWGVGTQFVIRVRGQAERFLAAGIPADELHQLAKLAGAQGVDLLEAARTLASQTNGRTHGDD